MAVGNHTLPQDLLDTCTDGLLYCMARWNNDITGGWFWVFMLLSFVVVILLSTLRFELKRAFGFAGFVSLIGGIYLAILRLMAWEIASIFIIIGILGIAQLVLQE